MLDLDEPSRKQQHLFSTETKLRGKLSIDVVVEVIETEARLAFLVRHGCNSVPRFLLSGPMTNEVVVERKKKTLKAATVA